ncbi:aldehyde reductase, partial [Phaeodactylum tricornutum CCAP 1055/1]
MLRCLVLHLENIELQKLVTTAYESNAAFFDTAERYGSHYKTAMGMGWGETEKMTRMLLDRIPPKEKAERITPVIATKFTPSPWRTSVQSVVEACEQSRERLGVEQIDLYQLHMPDIVQPFRFFGKEDNKDAIYWDGLAECYHRGLVKNVGVCNYGPTLVTRCQEALAKRGVPLASNQIAFSLMGRHNGAQETLDKCNEMGVKVLAFFPFAMGLLTGKYSSNDLSKIPLKESPILSLAESIAPLLMAMEQISKVRNKSVAQVALNYIICKGAIPIPGARTNAQVFDNIGAMGWRLTNTEVALLEQTA